MRTSRTAAEWTSYLPICAVWSGLVAGVFVVSPLFMVVGPMLLLTFNGTAIFVAALLHWTLRGFEHPRTVDQSPARKLTWGLATLLHQFFALQQYGFTLFFLFKGTAAMVWYFRLMGTKIGKRVVLNSIKIVPGTLVTIGDDVVIEHAARLGDGDMDATSSEKTFRRISIGDRTVVGVLANIRPGSHIGRDCVIHPNATVQGIVDDNHAVLATTVRKRVGLKTFADRNSAKEHRDDFQSTWQLADGHTASTTLLLAAMALAYMAVSCAATYAACFAAFVVYTALAAQEAVFPSVDLRVEVLGTETVSAALVVTVPLLLVGWSIAMTVAAILCKWLLVGRVKAGSTQKLTAW
eukprot:SAG22_NODE_969_length_6231_cov_4.839041_2_plen_351_part_00